MVGMPRLIPLRRTEGRFRYRGISRRSSSKPVSRERSRIAAAIASISSRVLILPDLQAFTPKSRFLMQTKLLKVTIHSCIPHVYLPSTLGSNSTSEFPSTMVRERPPFPRASPAFPFLRLVRGFVRIMLGLFLDLVDPLPGLQRDRG